MAEGASSAERRRARLDSLLAERGLFPSRSAAARAIRAGEVQLGSDGPFPTKPGHDVPVDQEIVLAEGPRYVSRGGVKLANALDRFGLEVGGLRCLDVGASTGGFTDCLLQRGASQSICLDVAYGQLDYGLRQDPRVTVIERANARDLRPEDLPYRPALTVIDVSFISLAKVMGPVASCMAEPGEMLAMVKPQFELGRKRVGRGGVVRDPGDRREAVLGVAEHARSLGLAVLGAAPSELPGPKGNKETFVRCANHGTGAEDLEAMLEGLEL